MGDGMACLCLQLSALAIEKNRKTQKFSAYLVFRLGLDVIDRIA
jgi:hypothetical protein